MKKKLLVYSNLSNIKNQLKAFKEYITIKTKLEESSKFDIIYLVSSNVNDINKMSKLLNPKGILLVSMPIKNLNNLSKKLLLIDIIENTYIYGKKIKGGYPIMSSNAYRNHMHHMSFYDNPYSQSTNYRIPNEQLQYHNRQLEYNRPQMQQLEYNRPQQMQEPIQPKYDYQRIKQEQQQMERELQEMEREQQEQLEKNKLFMQIKNLFNVIDYGVIQFIDDLQEKENFKSLNKNMQISYLNPKYNIDELKEKITFLNKTINYIQEKLYETADYKNKLASDYMEIAETRDTQTEEWFNEKNLQWNNQEEARKLIQTADQIGKDVSIYTKIDELESKINAELKM